MSANVISSEIVKLQKNQINYKIRNVQGYLVKKSSFSFCMEIYYERRSKLKICKKTGLKYEYFIHRPDNACVVFTECPIYNFYDDEEVEAKDGSIIVTIYESPEDFMASSLAAFYRSNYVGMGSSDWDEFGYFTTNSPKYNRIPIVNAISKLRPNRKERRAAPKERTCSIKSLFS